MSGEVPALGGGAVVAIDAADPAALARWWQRLVGGTITHDADGGTELRGAVLELDFFAVPEAKTVKNRVHIDLRTTDFDAAVQQVLALGATTADDIYDGDEWQVLRDPEGNEFCLLRP